MFADRPRSFHAGQVSNPVQNAIVKGFPTSPYFAAAISSAASGNSSLSICSSRSIVGFFILSLPSFVRSPGRRFKAEAQAKPGAWEEQTQPGRPNVNPINFELPGLCPASHLRGRRDCRAT
jgi:hypothetical protein